MWRLLFLYTLSLFVQGTFGNTYSKSKKLVKTDVGNIFLRQPDNYSNLLNLDSALEDNERKEGIKKMFSEFITPFSNKTTTKEGIKEVHKKEGLFILPAVKEELFIK